MSTTALAKRPQSEMTLGEMAQAFAASGFFQDARGAAQAIVKIQAGRELGFPPVASMTGIYIINGRVSLSANLIAAAIKRSGRYNYKVIEHTAKVCRIQFSEGGEPLGESTFTAEQARNAGTKNMDKFPEAMLFARAVTQGARWHCPDVFGGPVYTPEEMGAEVDEDGEPLNESVEMLDPAYVMGLEPRLADVGSSIAVLQAAVRRSGVDVGDNPAVWPADLKPRIEQWFAQLLKKTTNGNGHGNGHTNGAAPAPKPEPVKEPAKVEPPKPAPAPAKAPAAGATTGRPQRKRWPKPTRTTPAHPAYWRDRLVMAVADHLTRVSDDSLKAVPAEALADGIEQQFDIPEPFDADTQLAPAELEKYTVNCVVLYRQLLAKVQANDPSIDWDAASIPF